MDIKTQWLMEDKIQDLVLSDPESKKARTHNDCVKLVRKHLGKSFKIGNSIVSFIDNQEVVESIAIHLMAT